MGTNARTVKPSAEGEREDVAAEMDAVHEGAERPGTDQLERHGKDEGGNEHRPPGAHDPARQGADQEADADRRQCLRRRDRPAGGPPAGYQPEQGDRGHGPTETGAPVQRRVLPGCVDGPVRWHGDGHGAPPLPTGCGSLRAGWSAWRGAGSGRGSAPPWSSRNGGYSSVFSAAYAMTR